MIRAQQLIDRLFEARPRKKAVPPSTPEPVQAEPLMNPDEMTQFVMTGLKYGHLANMLHLIEKYDCDVSGRVRRTSSHYVHYNTIEFTWEVDVYDSNTVPPEDYALIGKLADKIQDEVDNEIKEISKKIYRALESAYEWSVSDEAVADNIIGNEYTFNQDGERADEGDDEDDGEGLFQYDQLSDAAKQKAREWYLEGDLNDESYSEPILEEWKRELENIGFGDPDISYSGFWSQGDGASFTCNSFDFKKYAHFFMSGDNTERSRPYTDELYAEEYRREAEAARGAPPPPPVAESDLGIDMEQFTRDSIYTDFSALAQHDAAHERHNAPWEKHYMTSKMAQDGKFFVRLGIFDAALSDKPGSVRVELYAQAWDMSPDGQKNAGNVNRKVRFFVPVGEKSKLISILLDYWLNAKGVADRRDKAGSLKDPQKMCRSLAHRLSLLAGLWKQEQSKPYNDHLDAQAKAFMDAMTPEQKAALEKKRAEWIAKHPEPSDEKLALRAEMKKWKAERDAAARAAVPPPAQESADEELMNQMGDVAIRGMVNSLGNIMREQPVRYMSGAKQFNWQKNTPDWLHTVYVTAMVYSEELPEQPWDISVNLKRGASAAHWRIDHSVQEHEKNSFALNVINLIGQLDSIVANAGPTPEGMMRQIEAVFNDTLGLTGTNNVETFTQY